VYGTLLLTLAAVMPRVNVPVLFAVEQFRAVMNPAGGFTVLVSVQVCPPMFKAKLAVPLLDGVPVIVYVNEPTPLAKVPAANVAVNPATPVDGTVCAVNVPPLPPVYGTLLLMFAAATPCVSVPLLVAVEQLRAVMLPIDNSTVLVSIQVCPPMLRAKLAVPLEVGVPKIL
jgi:hypothetical protein